ncbi:hypothetical protein KIN20_007141 [Parelaphostrongylus tenuis]|uniref:Uncharacterized protein n=1 Tax=Parelaphostrongylus tenuis TaxID=148309 RepID=A0AAD5QJT2_PARTN|nr:hypothetical protein KIN20_007141 [Parelaphostrongylus tenuis]
MANWSNAVWQNFVDRAVQMLELGPFGSHLSSVKVPSTKLNLICDIYNEAFFINCLYYHSTNKMASHTDDD